MQMFMYADKQVCRCVSVSPGAGTHVNRCISTKAQAYKRSGVHSCRPVGALAAGVWLYGDVRRPPRVHVCR